MHSRGNAIKDDADSLLRVAKKVPAIAVNGIPDLPKQELPERISLVTFGSRYLHIRNVDQITVSGDSYNESLLKHFRCSLRAKFFHTLRPQHCKPTIIHAILSVIGRQDQN